MSKHTDWTALIWGEHVQGHESEAAHQVQCGKHWAMVAEIPLSSCGTTHGEDGETRISEAEAIEHTYLIAAAPDMLEALEELLAIAPHKPPGEGLIEGIEFRHAEALKRARAAIAKAKGEAC